jgi:urease accessory protein UreH
LSYLVIWSLIASLEITRLPDSRSPAAIGRSARLELAFVRRGGRTVLAHSYAEPPYRIGRVFDLDDAAYVIIVCTGAGIFAGDTLHQTVHVGAGARVMLTSQSALQVHPAARPCPPAVSPCAQLVHQYTVAEDGELRCHWDPVIPFAGARLAQRFDLQVDDASRLYWSDALMAGRISRGEAWQFETLAHELSLRNGGSLEYLERYTVTPNDHDVAHPWIAGRARYVGTTIVHHEHASEGTAEAWHRAAVLPDAAGLHMAVDLVRPHTILARMLAVDGVRFAAARAAWHAAALTAIFRTLGQAARK